MIVSAHHWADGQPNRVEITTSAAPPMIYDFRGFPDTLYRITYPAPGAPGTGQRLHKSITYGVLAMDIYTFPNQVQTREQNS